MLTIKLMTLVLGAVQVFAAPISETLISRAANVTAKAPPSACDTARQKVDFSTSQLNQSLGIILPLLDETSTSNVNASAQIQATRDSALSVLSDIVNLAAANASNIPAFLPSLATIGLTTVRVDSALRDLQSARNGTNSADANLLDLFAGAISQAQTLQKDASTAISTCAAGLFAKEDESNAKRTSLSASASATATGNEPKSTTKVIPVAVSATGVDSDDQKNEEAQAEGDVQDEEEAEEDVDVPAGSLLSAFSRRFGSFAV